MLNAFLSNTSAFTLFLSGSPYRTDLFTEEKIDKRCEAGSGGVKLYTSMGDEDRKKHLDFFKTFCELLEEKQNESIDFKYEILPKRNNDDSYLLNWQDGLNYLFREWKATK